MTTVLSLSTTYGTYALLRIRDNYPGSEFFPSRIQGEKDSRIPDTHLHPYKKFKYFNPKN
jgi:hypothetical protein